MSNCQCTAMVFVCLSDPVSVGQCTVGLMQLCCMPCHCIFMVFLLYFAFIISWTSEDTLCVVLSRAIISMVENAIIMAALFY